VPYRQAVLWRREAKGRGSVGGDLGQRGRGAATRRSRSGSTARSPGSIPDTTDAPRPVGAADLSTALGEEWASGLPAHALWVPLALDPGHVLGALLLARESPWAMASATSSANSPTGCPCMGRVFSAVAGVRCLPACGGGQKYIKFAVAAAVVGAMCLPITLSALAPAEVVPFKPTIVRAPLDGVVDHFAVAPNAPVKQGQTLLELDPRRDPEQARGRRQGPGGGGRRNTARRPRRRCSTTRAGRSSRCSRRARISAAPM